MNDSATAPPPATPAQPAAPAGGARVWPVFVAHREELAPDRWRVYYPCAACGMVATVDNETGLCRPCWRPFVMLSSVLDEMRRAP